MKHVTTTCFILLVSLSLTGCSSLGNRWSDPCGCLRNKCRAQIAWHEWSRSYDELDHPHHFAKGFKAGYRDVLEGGNGCQPTLPPRCYWKSCYRSASGRCKINAWFDGFSHGALAAQQDGAGNWNEIPMSPTARLNLARASAPPQPTHWPSAGSPPPIASPEPPAMPQGLILQPAETTQEEAEWSTNDEREDDPVLDSLEREVELSPRPYE